MSENVVKFGDTHPITFCIPNTDLTGATEPKAVAKRRGTSTPLEVEISDAPAGKMTHVLTGDLPVGRYQIEVEFLDVEGQKHTAPTQGYAELWVYQDLIE